MSQYLLLSDNILYCNRVLYQSTIVALSDTIETQPHQTLGTKRNELSRVNRSSQLYNSECLKGLTACQLHILNVCVIT